MMHHRKHRVKAFTIMEVTISMMIAAIVIGITYTAYTIVSKSYLSFKAKNENMALLSRIDQLLARDFDQANIILNSGNGILIQKNNNTVRYEVLSNSIVRTSGIIDTFKVMTDNVKISFEGAANAIEDTNLSHNNNEGQRVDELSFNISFLNETIPCRYYKSYSSVNLIQRNPNAIN